MKDPNCSEESVDINADRTYTLERSLEESGHSEEESTVDEPRIPAIPQVHYVKWPDFAHRRVAEKQRYAIEVLIGGPEYFYQRSDEERKDKQRLQGHSNERDPLVTDHESSKLLPERIRINSKPVMLIMNRIDSTDRSVCPKVMLRPFKPLIYHEARIREVFQRLMTKWETVDLEVATDAAVKSSVEKVPDDGIIPASSDEPIDDVPVESKIKAETAPDDIVSSRNPTVTTSDKIIRQSRTIYQAPNPGDPRSPAPILNKDTKVTAIMEIEESSTKAEANIESKIIRNERLEDLTDSLEALRDLRCLIEFIDKELKPVADLYHNTTRQKIPFCDLWHLFKPGDLVHSPLGNKLKHDSSRTVSEINFARKSNETYQEVWRIVATTGGRPPLQDINEYSSTAGLRNRIYPFLLLVYWVDFNATRYVSRTFLFTISSFEGERDINSLP